MALLVTPTVTQIQILCAPFLTQPAGLQSLRFQVHRFRCTTEKKCTRTHERNWGSQAYACEIWEDACVEEMVVYHPLATPDLLPHHWDYGSGEFLRSFSSLHATLAINKYIHLSVYVCVQTIYQTGLLHAKPVLSFHMRGR